MSRPAIGVVCDLVEESWPSMDLVAARLIEALETRHAHEVRAIQLRPRMVRRATRLPRGDASPVASRIDRVLNRFVDYPRWLRGRRAGIDVFHVVDHSYAQLVHALPATRTVVTCHDIDTFRSVLEPASEPRGPLFRAMTRRILAGLKSARRVTCDSVATRDALLAHEVVPSDRLEVVYLGVSPVLTAEPQPGVDQRVAALLGPAEPDHPELLHVGSTIPRKRIDVLLRVFASVRETVPGVRLIRVGAAFTEEQASLAAHLGVNDGITVVPHLDHATLAGVYRRAALVLQPSSAEGFGLPVAEAMACGTPVVATDLPVLREVGGDAATYCGLEDIQAWRAAVGRLLEERLDPALWQARRRAAVGQASRFSWNRFAEQLVTIYLDLARG